MNKSRDKVNKSHKIRGISKNSDFTKNRTEITNSQTVWRAEVTQHHGNAIPSPKMSTPSNTEGVPYHGLKTRFFRQVTVMFNFLEFVKTTWPFSSKVPNPSKSKKSGRANFFFLSVPSNLIFQNLKIPRIPKMSMFSTKYQWVLASEQPKTQDFVKKLYGRTASRLIFCAE